MPAAPAEIYFSQGYPASNVANEIECLGTYSVMPGWTEKDVTVVVKDQGQPYDSQSVPAGMGNNNWGSVPDPTKELKIGGLLGAHTYSVEAFLDVTNNMTGNKRTVYKNGTVRVM